MMKKASPLKPTGLLLLLLLSALSGIAFTTSSQRPSIEEHPFEFLSLPQIDPHGITEELLHQRLLQDGRVRVIVALDIPYQLESDITEEIVVHVQRHRIAKAQGELESNLEGFDVEVIRKYRYIPYLTLDVDSLALTNLIDQPNIASVQIDLPVPAAAYDGSMWVDPGQTYRESSHGVGMVIAVLDTGVDPAHGALSEKIVAEACFSTSYPGMAASLCPGGNTTEFGPGSGARCSANIAGCDHGTLVAGVSVGDGEGFSGVAKDAGILSAQIYSQVVGSVCTEFGLQSPCSLTFLSDQMAALEWIYEQRSKYDIAAVSLSLGSGEYSALCDEDVRKPYIDFLLAEGIVTIVPAGSNGFSGAVNAPACISTTLSVGTAKDRRVATDSNLAAFTDVLVSTTDVQSTLPPGQHRETKESSLAAAYTAGVWAAFRSEAPSLPVSQLLELLRASGPSIRDDRMDSDGDPLAVPVFNFEQAWLSMQEWLSESDGIEPPTKPLPESVSSSDFRFAVTSDMQFASGPGDYDSPVYFRGAVEAIAEFGDISFMVSPGDITPVMSTYWTIRSVLGDEFVWYPGVGNHDLRNSDLIWLQSYDYGQVYSGPAGCPQTTYAFDYQDAHFIMLNVYCDKSGNRATDGDISTHLYTWLLDDLQRTDRSHIFVLGHEPAYPYKDEHNGVLRHFGGSLDANSDHRDRFWDLLNTFAVDAYICGHSHAFSAVRLENVWQINSGHAQGDAYALTDSTFLIIHVEGEAVTLEAFRAGGQGAGYDLKKVIQLR